MSTEIKKYFKVRLLTFEQEFEMFIIRTFALITRTQNKNSTMYNNAVVSRFLILVT